MPADRIHVAAPGVDAAELTRGTEEGGALLCVAAVIFDKGHDVLLDALATISELSWRCNCVGSLEREPAFVKRLRRRADVAGLGDRVSFRGPMTGAELDRSYADADVLVLASRAETYGMVVTEALARGLPVIAADVGGVAEALGHGADGGGPGVLGPTGRRSRARRRNPVLAHRRAPESATAPGRPRAACLAVRMVDHGVRRRRGSGGRRSRSQTMTAPPVRVSREWLALREAADAAARARELVERLRRVIPAAGPLEIHDLGGGTGAMGRWLAPLLPGPQHWVIHDRDRDLLELAVTALPGPAADGERVTVEARHSDITRIPPGDLAGATLITASALLDMLTEDELTGPRHWLCRARVPGAPHAVGRGTCRVEPVGAAGPPRGRRVRRPPTPPDAAWPPARSRRRRASRR